MFMKNETEDMGLVSLLSPRAAWPMQRRCYLEGT